LNISKCVPVSTLLDIIDNGLYGVEYQPLISLKTGDIYAYEALARLLIVLCDEGIIIPITFMLDFMRH